MEIDGKITRYLPLAVTNTFGNDGCESNVQILRYKTLCDRNTNPESCTVSVEAVNFSI